jgi:hypothetical protein
MDMVASARSRSCRLEEISLTSDFLTPIASLDLVILFYETALFVSLSQERGLFAM